jgi:hypothetical protein
MKTYICVLLEKLSQNSGQVRLLLNENIAVIAVLPGQSSEKVFHEGHRYMFSSNSSLTWLEF